jgi:hypothetical protein
MENPATWGKAERIIHDTLHQAETYETGMPIRGLSRARQVADALRAEGLLVEELHSVKAAESGEVPSDPADYGYDLLPSSGGVKIIPPTHPEFVICRGCGHVATEHKPGRFSIYGACPGTLMYAQRVAEQHGDLLDAATEDGM